MDSTETLKAKNTNSMGTWNPTETKPSHSIELRIIAGILVVALLLSIVGNGLIAIRIRSGSRTEAAATNYLVDNTDYVQQGRLERVQSKVQTMGVPETLEDFYRLAGTQIAEEKYPEALHSVGICLMLCSEDNHDLYVDLLMKKGCLLVLVNQFSEALTVLDQVITRQPDLADAYLVKAQVYAAWQKNDALAAALISYLDLVPEDSEIRLVLGQTQYLLGNFEAAATEYAYILEKAAPDQDVSQAAYLCGLTNLQLERYDQAVPALIKARSQDPKLEAIDYYIGVCQMSLEQYAEAAENLTKSVDQNVMVQLSRYSRGICRLMLDESQYQGALEDLQFAADYQGSDADQTVSGQAANLITELKNAETLTDDNSEGSLQE